MGCPREAGQHGCYIDACQRSKYHPRIPVEPYTLEMAMWVPAVQPAVVNWVISGKSENFCEAHFVHLCHKERLE